MNCTCCGQPIIPGSLFCPNCGQPCADPGRESPPAAPGYEPIPYPREPAAPGYEPAPYPQEPPAAEGYGPYPYPEAPTPPGAAPVSYPEVPENAVSEEAPKQSFFRRNWFRLLCATTLVLSVGLGLFLLLRKTGPKLVPTFLAYTTEDGVYVRLQSMKEGVCVLETDETETVCSWISHYMTDSGSDGFYLCCRGYQLSEDQKTLYFAVNYRYQGDDAGPFECQADLYCYDFKKKDDAELIEKDVFWFSSSRDGRLVYYLTADQELCSWEKRTGKSKSIERDVVGADASFDGKRLVLLAEDGEKTVELRVMKNGKEVFSEGDVLLNGELLLNAERDHVLYSTDSGDDNWKLWQYSGGKAARIGSNCTLLRYFIDTGVYDDGSFYYCDEDNSVFFWDGKKAKDLDIDLSSTERVLNYDLPYCTPRMAFYSREEGLLLYERGERTEIPFASGETDPPSGAYFVMFSKDGTCGCLSESYEGGRIYAFDLTDKNPKLRDTSCIGDLICVLGDQPLYRAGTSDESGGPLYIGRTRLASNIDSRYLVYNQDSVFFLVDENGSAGFFSLDSSSDSGKTTLFRLDGADKKEIASGKISIASWGRDGEVVYAEDAGGDGYTLTWLVGDKTAAKEISGVQYFGLITDPDVN